MREIIETTEDGRVISVEFTQGKTCGYVFEDERMAAGFGEAGIVSAVGDFGVDGDTFLTRGGVEAAIAMVRARKHDRRYQRAMQSELRGSGVV